MTRCLLLNVLSGLVVLTCISLSETLSGSKAQAGCLISLQRDIPDNEPLYLKRSHGNYSFFKPINETNSIPINNVVSLSCLGKRNHFVRNPINFIDIVCRNGNRFMSFENSSIVRLSDLNCTKSISADLKISPHKCANNRGHLYDIGFRINERSFLSVFKVCYDNITETTFFTRHEINGAAIKYSIKENKRRGFQTNGLATTNISQVYNKRNQERHFANIFGENQQYINSSMFLARGHLTPDADFVFPNFQLSTYFYINTAPEFQVINAGNWIRIENMVRALATEYGSDFLIYTGVHEVLQLPNQSGLHISVHLDTNEKIPVPKWFWKAIKNTNLDAGIVFITLNNPFATRSAIMEFCPNVCDRASLTSKHFQNIRKGYTFCCEIGKFKQIVKGLPYNFAAKSIINCDRASHLLMDEGE